MQSYGMLCGHLINLYIHVHELPNMLCHIHEFDPRKERAWTISSRDAFRERHCCGARLFMTSTRYGRMASKKMRLSGGREPGNRGYIFYVWHCLVGYVYLVYNLMACCVGI